jgi:GMP synthase-like glutamine amidotransferase
MLIGIIETGRPAEKLRDHGSYPDMFRRLLGPQSQTFQFRTYAAIDGEMPSDPHVCDGWLITGSRHGAYERLPWMVKLEDFLRRAVAEKVPLVGICFGHQILAQALGGKVEKSDRGWGFGLHEYRVLPNDVAGSGVLAAVTLPALHQDQVVEVPVGARVIGESDFCPNAILAYGDTALSFQPHPEFDLAFMRGVSEHRLKGIAPETVLEDAKRTFEERTSDSPAIAAWIARFFLEQSRRTSNPQAAE